MTLQTHDQAEHEQDAADSTHEPILTGAEELARREAEFRTLMAKRTDPSIKLFYDKLQARLQMVGVALEKLDYKSDQSDPPPCFKANGTDYGEWLRFASVGAIPLRMDMPGEPNYCNDCTPQFKLKSEARGQCLFPLTRFETRKESGEQATAGVSRSCNSAPSEYVIYQEMVVPVEALANKLKSYVRKRSNIAVALRAELAAALNDGRSPGAIRRIRQSIARVEREATNFRLSDTPPAVAESFARINWIGGSEA